MPSNLPGRGTITRCRRVACTGSLLLAICLPAADEVADTSFSDDRGFYEAAFDLTISTATAGAEIRYTLDGSEPGLTSGRVYEGPIPISTSTVVRAMAHAEGLTPTDVDTQTYLFLADVIRQPATLPGGYETYSVSLGGGDTGTHDHAMDPRVVDDPDYADEIIPGLLAIPSMCLSVAPSEVTGSNGFYRGSSDAICSVEILFPDRSDVSVQADARVNPHSHDRMKRSLRLNFSANDGADPKLRSDLLQRATWHGDTAVDRFDRLVLRGGNNRCWARSWNPDKTAYTIDQWQRDSQLACSGYGMRGTFVHLYINGIYWGLYNPVERGDADFCADYFGGDDAEWFARNHGGAFGSGSTDSSRFDHLVDTVSTLDVDQAEHWQTLHDHLDVDGFCDYLMLQWYAGVGDWPRNNWYANVRNDPNPGPVRYLAWDAEWSWDAPRGGSAMGRVHPDFQASDTGGRGSAEVWNNLKNEKEFLLAFADRVYRNFFNDGPLTVANNLARWQALNEGIRSAVIAESARWGDGAGSLRTRDEDWQAEVDAIAGFIAQGGEGGAPLQDDFIADLRAEGYYPAIDPPVISAAGTAIASRLHLAAAGDTLQLANPNGSGEIVYTRDGSDPRRHGGSLAASATTIDAAELTIEHSQVISARVRDGDDWSALRVLTVSSIAAGAAPPVVINEVLTHTDPPLVDAIELYNPTDQAVDIGTWFLSDDEALPRRWMIPAGTTIPAGGYIVFFEDDDDDPLNNDDLPADYFGGTFSLSSFGEDVLLTAPDGSLVHHMTFDGAANGVSFGRYPLSDGREAFPAQTERTLGAANAGPRIGPVVISAIDYHPDEAGDEFIVCRNISESQIDCFDPDHPEHTWELRGADAEFPPAISLPPGGRLWLIRDGDDPAAFRAAQAIPADEPIISYAGQLDNGGERLRLMRPGDPDPVTDAVPMIVVDGLRYDDESPWPTAPDGLGPHLVKVADTLFGAEPTHWQSSDADGPGRRITLRLRRAGDNQPLAGQADPGSHAGVPQLDESLLFDGLIPAIGYTISLSEGSFGCLHPVGTTGLCRIWPRAATAP